MIELIKLRNIYGYKYVIYKHVIRQPLTNIIGHFNIKTQNIFKVIAASKNKDKKIFI